MSTEPDLELKALLSKHGRQPVTLALLDETISALQAGLRAAFEKHRDARLVLEQRVAALEGRPAMKFCGVHDRQTKAYSVGDVVTHAGSLWTCTVPTTGPFAHSAWKLIAKRGSGAE